MRYLLFSLLATWFVAFFVACTERPQPLTMTDLFIVRSYGWNVNFDQPQADWHPRDNVVLAVGYQSLHLYREGAGNERRFQTGDHSQPFQPYWWGDSKVVYGPPPDITQSDDGTLILPSAGLSVCYYRNGSLSLPESIYTKGYQPFGNGDELYFVHGNEMYNYINKNGDEPYGEAFHPMAQPGGPGLLWFDRPLSGIDYWTGRQTPAQCIVRWGPKQTSILQQVEHAMWTDSGGLIYIVSTRSDRSIPWREGSTELRWLSSFDAQPQTIAKDVIDVDVHPSGQFAAITKGDGRLQLVAMDGSGREEAVAESGWRPRWNADGSRLLIEKPLLIRPEHRRLQVYVFEQKRSES